jgi:hypothetical protein
LVSSIYKLSWDSFIPRGVVWTGNDLKIFTLGICTGILVDLGDTPPRAGSNVEKTSYKMSREKMRVV